MLSLDGQDQIEQDLTVDAAPTANALPRSGLMAELNALPRANA